MWLTLIAQDLRGIGVRRSADATKLRYLSTSSPTNRNGDLHMQGINVTFTFHSGVRRRLFQNVRLTGSWDITGKHSSQWSQVAMASAEDGTGCDAFSATVALDATQVGT